MNTFQPAVRAAGGPGPAGVAGVRAASPAAGVPEAPADAQLPERPGQDGQVRGGQWSFWGNKFSAFRKCHS